MTTLATVKGTGDIAVSSEGNIFVADFGDANLADGEQIVLITPTGASFVFAMGLPPAVTGLAFTSDGDLIVGSFAGTQVSRITPEGMVTAFANVSQIIGVEVTDNGEVFAVGCGQNAVFRLPGDGSFEVFATGFDLRCPNGITQGHDAALYVVNFRSSNVLRVDENGVVSVFARTEGNGNNHIEFVNNTYYITSRTTNKVFEMDTEGVVSVLAGTGMDGNDDGPADQATFSSPNGIGASADGRFLYISGAPIDSAGRVPIRRIELPETSGYSIDSVISGAWFNPQTPGQGWLLEVIESTDQAQLFAAWFTYAPAASKGAFSADTQRWFTAQGPIDNDTATMTLTVTEGGAFDDATAVNNRTVGSLSLSFDTCASGRYEYEIDGVVSGSGSIARVAAVDCE